MTLRVLNTRPAEQAAELSGLLRAAGFSVVELPAIAFAPAFQSDDMQRVRMRLLEHAYQWLVLPSANAWRFLIEGLGSADEVRAVPLVCGTSTAQQLGLSPRIA